MSKLSSIRKPLLESRKEVLIGKPARKPKATPMLDFPLAKLLEEYLKITDKKSPLARKYRRIFNKNGKGIRSIRTAFRKEI